MLASRAAKPPARLMFEEGAGLVLVDILREAGRVVGAELTAPQPLSKLSQFSAEQAAACISLTAADVENRPPSAADRLGRPAVPDGGTRLARCGAAGAARRCGVRRTFPCDGAYAIYFYTRDVPPAEKPCDLQARMFYPGSSGLIRRSRHRQRHGRRRGAARGSGRRRDGELKLRIGQGVDMGRPSLLLTRVLKTERRYRVRPCRRGLRADDGRDV